MVNGNGGGWDWTGGVVQNARNTIEISEQNGHPFESRLKLDEAKEIIALHESVEDLLYLLGQLRYRDLGGDDDIALIRKARARLGDPSHSELAERVLARGD